MYALFLDFNGVLDTYQEMDKIDKEILEILREIVQTMEAKIVISSSIKNTYYFTGNHNSIMRYLIETLEQAGMEVYGFTPKCNSREKEIISYLKMHHEITDYCVLEDEYDLSLLQSHVIKLPSQSIGGNGLKELEKEVIKILKKGGDKNGKN